MQVTEHLDIAENELSERFLHASGPGGQHVNKTATAVQLRFDAAASSSLPPAVRMRLLAMRDPRISANGMIVIVADRYRSQARNRTDARMRLAQLILRAAQAPKKRRPTRVPRKAKKHRLDKKRRLAQTKQLRKRPPTD